MVEEPHFAGHLLMQGHEVWLLDHGLSSALKPATGAQPSIDDISKQVGAAVRFVYDASRVAGTTGGVHVFSHCVGSAALSMSILRGDLEDHGKPIIGGLVMHAVPPWIQPSESNLLRAYVGAFFKDRFFPEWFDPIPYDDTGGPEMPIGHLLLDRFASSLPWTESEYAQHSPKGSYDEFPRTVCNRMTALYGYEWSHDNLDRRTHQRIASLVGPANAEAYRQLYYLLNRKRVTDKEGHNDFVQIERFLKHWNFPTLFLHGSANRVFDAESSRLSAYYLALINQLPAPGRTPQTVDLKVINGYGHMDLLFGKEAWGHVYPHVSAFFEKGGSGRRNEAPHTDPAVSTVVVTGPIISRPRVDGAERTLRIWAESDEFQASKALSIEFRTAGGALPARLVSAGSKQSAHNPFKHQTFWLYDVDCATAGGAVEPFVDVDDPGVGLVLSLAPAPSPRGTVDWHALPWFKRFLAHSSDDRLSFIVGSCWYPGSWFDHAGSDRIFDAIRREVEQGRGIDHLLLVGDQIYADATREVFDIAEHRERYQESYRRAITSPRAAWVLGHVPTYFAVDDHEFTDNYPASILGGPLGNEPEPDGLLSDAAREAWNFQMHHAEEAFGTTNRLWYGFQSAGFDGFVFDTRSERKRGETGVRRLISAEQEAGFIDWLDGVKSHDRPLFLVTGSPVAPFPIDEVKHPARAAVSDTLRARPEFLEFLASQAVRVGLKQKVVLLSGDPHFSSICDLDVIDASGAVVFEFVAIVSSGVNVPLPFANDVPEDTEWADAVLKPVDSAIALRSRRAELVSTVRAHVLRLDVQRDKAGAWTLSVTAVLASVDAEIREHTRRLTAFVGVEPVAAKAEADAEAEATACLPTSR